MEGDISSHIADGAAILGIVCLVVWPLSSRREAILAFQIGAGFAFTVHYGLIGLGAAAAISGLGMLQSLAAVAAPRCRSLERIGFALIPAMVASALWFWTGPVTLLAALAMTLIALGRMSRNDVSLRLLILSGCTAWLVHDALVGAWLMVAGDVLSWIVGASALSWPILARRLASWRSRLSASIAASGA